MLLCAAGSIPTVVRTELARLAPAEIVVVGGTGALSPTVGSDAGAYAPVVTRVAGVDRYATSAALVRRVFSDAPVTSLSVATGRDYPDALVTGAAAGADRSPVLVVDGRASRLRTSTATLVQDLAAPAVHVAGGTAGVGEALVTHLAAVSGVDVQRHAGADRYATAVAVNGPPTPSSAPARPSSRRAPASPTRSPAPSTRHAPGARSTCRSPTACHRSCDPSSPARR